MEEVNVEHTKGSQETPKDATPPQTSGATITPKDATPPQTSGATIFVGNLPFDTQGEQLEKEFSEIGPIKRAFVVKDKDNRSKSRGCGYVQFVLQEDADKCVKLSKTIGNRKLRLNYAAKKPKHAKRKALALQQAAGTNPDSEDKEEKENLQPKAKKVKVAEDNSVSQETLNENDKNTNKNDPLPKKESNNNNNNNSNSNNGNNSNNSNNNNSNNNKNSNNNSKTDLQRTIVLTGLTSKVKRKAFRILCEQFGEIENIVYPVPEREEVSAFVRFKEYKSAIRATQKIPGRKVKKSGILSACLLTKENKFPSKKKLKQARLIIRNLSFKCEEADLRAQLSKYGKILDVNIPTKKVNGKDVKIGCAFVQFADTANAKVALTEMNLKEIMGRQVVVDWAVAKNMYTEKKLVTETEENDTKLKEKAEEEKKGKKGKKKEGDKDKDMENDSDDKKKKKTAKKEKGGKEGGKEKEKKGKQNENENDADDMDDSDEDDDEDVDGYDDDEDVDDDIDENGEEDDNDDIHDDEGSEDEISEDNDDEEDDEPIEKPKRQLKDAKEGKTIFVRNLSYDVDEDMLQEEFDKYGEIDYCKIVHDHESGRSKGTAFIKYKEKKSADDCIQEFDKKEKLGVNVVIDGRPIVVAMAVTKGKLGEIQHEKVESKKETDKRNLYLASEGIVTRNSPAAEGLSDADLKKREKALAEKKAKLKNPNFFVSRTRLCAKNLPLAIEADGILVAFKKFVPREITIGKVKIMRSKDRRDLKGMPRSLGFAFIEMETHEDALTLLRAINNNPKVFDEKRRPIVEFSVENAKALKILELKKTRLDAKQQHYSENSPEEKTETDQEDKKAMKAKAYEKKKKRIARYKKKREAKKLLKNNDQNPDDSIKDSPKNNANNKKLPPAKKKDSVVKSQNIVERGFKRTLPNVADQNGIQQGRKTKKKKTEKEEEKFNTMVQQYKQKLFGNNNKTTKKRNENRWFE